MGHRTSSPGIRGVPLSTCLPAAGVVLLLLLLHFDALTYLWARWAEDKMLSHGFVVPVVALLIGWRRWAILRSVPQSSDGYGWLFLLFSALLLLAGGRGGYEILEALSLTIALPGAFLLLQGRKRTAALAFPFLYLQFMLPWIVQLTDRLNWPFQLASARIGINLLHLAGIGAYRESNFIHLPRITLEVAEACSGVGFLVSVIALALPLTYITQKDRVRAGAVVLSGVPLTVLVNGFRVGMIGRIAHTGRTDILHGPAHVFQAWFVAQAGFLLLFFVNFLVYRADRRDLPRLVDRPVDAGSGGGPSTPARMAPLVLFLSALLAFMHFAGSPAPVPLPVDPASLPHRIGPWLGKADAWMDTSAYAPESDLTILRSYERPDGRKVHLLLLRYDRQTQGDRLFSYRLKPLVRGEEERSLPGGPGGTERVGFSRIRLGGSEFESVHWFRTLDRIEPAFLPARLRSFRDGVLHGKNPVVFTLLATPADPSGGGEPFGALSDFHLRARGDLDRPFIPPPHPAGGG